MLALHINLPIAGTPGLKWLSGGATGDYTTGTITGRAIGNAITPREYIRNLTVGLTNTSDSLGNVGTSV